MKPILSVLGFWLRDVFKFTRTPCLDPGPVLTFEGPGAGLKFWALEAPKP
jgi:hypothetical protein